MKIAIVGEAPGQKEWETQSYFVGPSGQLLWRDIMAKAGIERKDVYVTNVFKNKPPENQLKFFCDGKRVVEAAYKQVTPKRLHEYWEITRSDPSYVRPPYIPIHGPGVILNYNWPEKYDYIKLGQAGYVKPEWLPALAELKAELLAINPNVIIAAGNTPCWALLGRTGIGTLRGYVFESPLTGHKVVPMYHPAAVMRQYAMMPLCILDAQRAKREAVTSILRRPKRTIIINPTLQELKDWYDTEFDPSAMTAFDVETAHEQITIMGFSQEAGSAVVFPFVKVTKDGLRVKVENYWDNPEDEVAAWEIVKAVLEGPCPLVAQNGNYDIQYLWGLMGIRCNNFAEDTMLMHHVLQPELPKSLGFLASVYADTPVNWKYLRRLKPDVEKADE